MAQEIERITTCIRFGTSDCFRFGSGHKLGYMGVFFLGGHDSLFIMATSVGKEKGEDR